MWAFRSKLASELRKEYQVPPGDESLTLDEPTPESRNRFGKVLDLMPESVRVRAEDVEGRFKGDWLRVRDVWVRSFLLTIL